MDEEERAVPTFFRMLDDAKELPPEAEQRLREALIANARVAKQLAMRIKGWGSFFGESRRSTPMQTPKL